MTYPPCLIVPQSTKDPGNMSSHFRLKYMGLVVVQLLDLTFLKNVCSDIFEVVGRGISNSTPNVLHTDSNIFTSDETKDCLKQVCELYINFCS